MRYFLIIAFLLAAPAHAAEPKDNPASMIRGAGSVVPGSMGSTLRAKPSQPDPMMNSSLETPTSKGVITTALDPRFCQMLTKHSPSSDVAYQPGVTVDGNPVAPADLPSSTVELPTKLTIPLTVSLTKLLNINPNQPPFNQLGTGTEGVIGNLTVEGDKVYFNGKPLTDDQQDNLAVVCLKQK